MRCGAACDGLSPPALHLHLHQVGCSSTCKCLNCKNRFRDRRGNTISKTISLEQLQDSTAAGFLGSAAAEPEKAPLLLPPALVSDVKESVALLLTAADDWTGEGGKPKKKGGTPPRLAWPGLLQRCPPSPPLLVHIQHARARALSPRAPRLLLGLSFVKMFPNRMMARLCSPAESPRRPLRSFKVSLERQHEVILKMLSLSFVVCRLSSVVCPGQA